MINGHATATLIGDPVEAEALKEVLATPDVEMLKNEVFATGSQQDKSNLKNTLISAYKGHLGHLNLASGATEIALCIMAMQEQKVPGIANLHNPCDDELVFAKHKEIVPKKIDRFVKVAVGFGANNACLALERCQN